jgi:hypothetical protein
MNLLKNKNIIGSLELVEEINIFRKEERSNEEKKNGICKNRLYANITHDALLKVIREEFEEEISLGELNETTYVHSQNGQTYPMFNLTLSQAKQVLVKESKKVRKAIIARIEKLEQALHSAPKPKTQIELIIESALVLQNHESRLSDIENKLENIEKSKHLALLELNEIERSTEIVPEIGTRLKINQIVRTYSEKTGIDYRDIWNKMYSNMLYVYRFNVNAYKKLHPKETKLDIIERENQLDNLYALVSKELC